MDDTLRNIAIGLFAFLGLHGALHERIHLAAKRQVSEAFDGSGRVEVAVAPRGFVGLEANDLYSVDVDAVGIMSDRLPFYVFPRAGWKGRIHHLRLHFKDFALRGLHVEELRADIPHASYDLGHAFYRSRLVLRGAGEGPATVRVNALDLQAFILKKYNHTLSDVIVEFQNNKIIVQGSEDLFGHAPFRALGELSPRAGRFLDLNAERTVFELNNKIVNESTKNGILKLINPVLDLESDLGLGGYFVLERVEIHGSDLVIYGHAAIPVAPPGTQTP